MEQWKSILIKFLKHFYLDYEEDTAEDYLGDIEVESIQTKNKSGGYCSITGMPFKYDQPVSFADALSDFKNSLTPEETLAIHIGSRSEEYPDVEEHDEERECTTIKIALNSSHL